MMHLHIYISTYIYNLAMFLEGSPRGIDWNPVVSELNMSTVGEHEEDPKAKHRKQNRPKSKKKYFYRKNGRNRVGIGPFGVKKKDEPGRRGEFFASAGSG